MGKEGAQKTSKRSRVVRQAGLGSFLSVRLRERTSENSTLPRHSEVALDILRTTGMRYADLRLICRSAVTHYNTVCVPGVKRGKPKVFILTDFQREYILAHPDTHPFAERPTYNYLYRRFCFEKRVSSIYDTRQHRSILCSMRKKKIRGLIRHGESFIRVVSVFGWKTVNSIGYYL